MEIKIYGPGCKKCQQAADAVQTAVAELGLTATVIKVSEIREIAAAGIMSTPAVAVNGEIKSTGRVPSSSDLKAWLAGQVSSGPGVSFFWVRASLFWSGLAMFF